MAILTHTRWKIEQLTKKVDALETKHNKLRTRLIASIGQALHYIDQGNMKAAEAVLVDALKDDD